MKSKRCPIILLCAFVSKEKKSVCTLQEKKERDATFLFIFFFGNFFPLKGRGKSEKEGQKERKERKGKERKEVLKSKVGTTTTKTRETNAY